MLGGDSILAAVESVKPFEVILDDMEHFCPDVELVQNEQQIDGTDILAEKNNRRAEKKAKEQREREIRGGEEELLEKDVPKSADEFEKLVRSSTNSSSVWIKYMALMLSLNDIDQARYIVETSLKERNYWEENEEMNIWVMYFNLENQYGNLPKDNVSLKILSKATRHVSTNEVDFVVATRAIILGFDVGVPSSIKSYAERKGVIVGKEGDHFVNWDEADFYAPIVQENFDGCQETSNCIGVEQEKTLVEIIKVI